MKRLLVIWLSLGLFSCNGAQERSLTVYLKCSDVETAQDIERSIDKNSAHFKNKNIILKESKDDKCGYLLKYKDKENFIQGARTDFDLLLEVEKFFDIRIVSEEYERRWKKLL